MKESPSNQWELFAVIWSKNLCRGWRMRSRERFPRIVAFMNFNKSDNAFKYNWIKVSHFETNGKRVKSINLQGIASCWPRKSLTWIDCNWKLIFRGLTKLCWRLFRTSAWMVLYSTFYFAAIGNRGTFMSIGEWIIDEIDLRSENKYYSSIYFFSRSACRHPAKFRLHLFHNLFSSQISFYLT